MKDVIESLYSTNICGNAGNIFDALYDNCRSLHTQLHTICVAYNKYKLIPCEVFFVKAKAQRVVGVTQSKITYNISQYINDERQRHASIHSRRKQKSSIGT
jgi:hypothetical protein